VADDDAVTRSLLAEAAAQAGLDVIAVGDGAAAIRVAKETVLAAAMLDVEMPGADGYSVCRALRCLPGNQSLPIVMITGREEPRSIERAFEAGATDFIGKPVNWSLLPHRLRYMMRNAAMTRALERREAENRALIESIPDRVHLCEASGVVLRDLNRQGTQDSQPASHSRQVADMVPAADAPRVHAALLSTAQDGLLRDVEYTSQSADGSQRHYELRLARCGQGEVMLLERDVTTRHAQEERIRRLAYTDELTGLPNRLAFVERLDALLPAVDVANEHVAVLYLDLDDFRRINDTFGHDVGDELIRAFAALLGAAVQHVEQLGSAADLARFGGDEFVIALRHPAAQEQAVELVRWLNARLAEPFRCGAHEFFVATSVGIAVLPEHGRDAATLVRHADAALHCAKDHGDSDPVVFAPEFGEHASEQLALDGHLRRAVRGGMETFELHYQPKYSLADGSMTGAEALLRWQHPELGAIAPDQFIPLAERNGLILDLGAWLARSACHQLRHWLDRGFDTWLAINVSGTELLYGNPARVVAEACAEAAIDPARLEIEITESVLVSDSTQVQQRLRELRQLGCRIALDDFGTGYSSLAYLKRLLPDSIKIDRLFVRQIHLDQDDAAIFTAIQSLARHHGLTLTAEGVEDPAQLQWLCDHGCDQAQGFLLGRPMPARRLEQLLEAEATPCATQRRSGSPGRTVSWSLRERLERPRIEQYGGARICSVAR
jgi:diguanylate cyclase (GGDEF)-like protein